MRLRIGSPKQALIVAPHPDDEVVGAYGLIVALRRQHIRVRILVVTDGRASHRGSAGWPLHRLVRERKRETRRAMRRLGIPAGELTFLGLPDGALGEERHMGVRIVQAAAKLCRSGLLVVPSDADDHPDHRATARALARLRLPGMRRLSYRVWPPGAAPRSARPVLLSQNTRTAKRGTLLGYRTQTGLIADDPEGFSMTHQQIAGFCRPVEYFREHRR